MPDPTSNRLYALPTVRERIGGFSRAWVYQAIKEGRFPPPVKVGARAVRWREADLSAWEASLAGASQ